MSLSSGFLGGGNERLRQKLIEAGVVDVMIAVGSNFFYTVTLPCTLWFLDKGKTDTTRKNKVLFKLMSTVKNDRQTLFPFPLTVYHQIDRSASDQSLPQGTD